MRGSALARDWRISDYTQSPIGIARVLYVEARFGVDRKESAVRTSTPPPKPRTRQLEKLRGSI
jgi:hypothetical protein